MKRYRVIGLLGLVSLFLLGCVSSVRCPYPKAGWVQETWRHEVDTQPTRWTAGADRWFLTGDPNEIEEANRQAACSAAITTMTVRVPDFTDIKVNGAFQVQLFGSDHHNSVSIYGPHVAVRQIAVDVSDHTLYLHQKTCSSRHMGRVIVRVGMVNLHHLTQWGSGLIEGRQLYSDFMKMTIAGRGSTYLMGQLSVRRITQTESGGALTLLGVETPVLDIDSSGEGAIRVSGRAVGVRSIRHTGRSSIHIIGARTPALTIHAKGSGKISLYGEMNVKEIIAKENIHLYLYWVHSGALNLYLDHCARVGLAGHVQNLYVDASRSARFEGRYLYARDAYVRAHDWAHINVAASNKIFAAATENGSVYFFGSPQVLSQFVSGHGVVIPLWTGQVQPLSLYTRTYHPAYKGERGSIAIRSPKTIKQKKWSEGWNVQTGRSH